MASKDWIFKSYVKFPFPQKNDVAIFDEGELSNDGNSPSICSDFRSIPQNKEHRDFDDNAKSKNRDTETERGAKRKDKNDSDELTEEANDTSVQCSVLLKQNRGFNPKIGKGLN